MKWAIYYGDGTKFTNLDGEPQDAPCRDVQAIVQESDRVGWYIVRSADVYIWKGYWIGADWIGFLDYMFDPGCKVAKFGRTLRGEEYNRIYYQAKADRDFARKAGFLPEERKPT